MLIYTTNDDVLFIINMIASSVCSKVHDDYFFRSIIHDFSDVLQLYRLLKITVRFFNNRPTLFFKTFFFSFLYQTISIDQFHINLFFVASGLSPKSNRPFRDNFHTCAETLPDGKAARFHCKVLFTLATLITLWLSGRI
jgi:hypothetical protein